MNSLESATAESVLGAGKTDSEWEMEATVAGTLVLLLLSAILILAVAFCYTRRLRAQGRPVHYLLRFLATQNTVFSSAAPDAPVLDSPLHLLSETTEETSTPPSSLHTAVPISTRASLPSPRTLSPSASADTVTFVDETVLSSRRTASDSTQPLPTHTPFSSPNSSSPSTHSTSFTPFPVPEDSDTPSSLPSTHSRSRRNSDYYARLSFARTPVRYGFPNSTPSNSSTSSISVSVPLTPHPTPQHETPAPSDSWLTYCRLM